MGFRKDLGRDDRAVSSFSLLAIIVLLFATFTVSYLSYVSYIDMNYRIRMEELTKMEFRYQEVTRDLEDHALFLAQWLIHENREDDFGDEYDTYIDRLGEEGFDIWLGGDVRAAIDGVYAVIGGTIGENYTVTMDQNAGGYLVEGSFNVTVRNTRTSIEVHKVLSFRKQISAPYPKYP